MSKGGGTAIGRGHERIGTMACLVCEKEIPVKLTQGGKLSACCQWCDLPLYVNARTEAFDRVMRRVKRDAPPAATKESAASTGPASPPASASSSSAPAAAERKDPPARRFTGPLGNPFGV